MALRTPLALLSLLHNRRRLIASALGIGFAVLLMLTELGFMTAINDSTTLWVDAMAADLVVISHLKDDINPSKPFPLRRLERLRAHPAVDDAYPLYVSRVGSWKSAGRVQQDIIRVVAFDPRQPAIDLPGIEDQRHILLRDDVALVDRRLRDSYGGLATGIDGELNGRAIQVQGDYALGPDLQLNATLVVSDLTFRRCFLTDDGRDPLEWVDFGLLQIADGGDPGTLQRQLQQRAGDDLLVLTRDGLKERIHRFWLYNQPVGAVFGIGMVVGFLIGMAICYQILFTDVIDQLPQLATLKAMGYRDAYLFAMTLRRSLYLALAALILGLPCGWLTFEALQRLTGLTFTLTFGRAAVVSLLTILMCGLAGLIAMRRAIAADPAELF